MFGFLKERRRRNEGLSLLREVARRGLQDNKLDAQDLAEVNRIETEYGLPSELAQEAVDKVRLKHGSAVLKRETEAILADGRYDDEEERRLNQLLADLGTALPPDVKAVLAKAKQFYQIEIGNAPEVLDVGINLTRGERCHFRGVRLARGARAYASCQLRRRYRTHTHLQGRLLPGGQHAA